MYWFGETGNSCDKQLWSSRMHIKGNYQTIRYEKIGWPPFDEKAEIYTNSHWDMQKDICVS